MLRQSQARAACQTSLSLATSTVAKSCVRDALAAALDTHAAVSQPPLALTLHPTPRPGLQWCTHRHDFKCGRCSIEGSNSKSVSMHQSRATVAKRKNMSTSITSQNKAIRTHDPCRGNGILCVTTISNSGVCLSQATTWHETPNTPPLPRHETSMCEEDCDNIDVDADSWTYRGNTDDEHDGLQDL